MLRKEGRSWKRPFGDVKDLLAEGKGFFFLPPCRGKTVLTRSYFVILTPIQILPALEAAVDPRRLLDPDSGGTGHGSPSSLQPPS